MTDKPMDHPAPEGIGPHAFDHGRAIVVDDSKVMQMRVKSMLEGLGCEVVACSDDGEAGLKSFRLLRPNLVVLDHTMPGMDGVQCAREIRALQSPCGIIVLSASIDGDLVRKYASLGIREILAKPVQLEQFSKAVERSLQALNS